MKVNKCEIQSVTAFKSSEPKRRVITPDMQEYSKILLNKMNNSTKYAENQDKTGFTSDILSSVSMGEKIKFYDNRYLITKNSKSNKIPSLCTLQIGKNKIIMDTNSGEILNYKKSIFRTWSSLFKQAELCLQEFLVNFDEPNIVKKNFFGIQGLTQKGYEILKEVQNKIYYGKK